MIHPRTAGLLGALLLAALLLAGCGGGGGEPTVSQGVHDVLQHELEEALEELKAEREAKTREAAARRTAQGEVTRLDTELATSNTAVTRLTGELTTAQGEVTRLKGERDTATTEVTRLTGRIGTAGDAASAAESASLYAQLNHARAEATRLTGELATATTNADDLTTKLMAANAKVTELTGRIGNASDAASAAETASLHAQLNHANAEVVRLTAELSGTKSAVETLRGQLGTVRTELEEEEEAREAAEQRATVAETEVDQRASNLEANQRAQNLRNAFPGEAGASVLTAITETPTPVVITVPTSGRLTLTRGRQTATLSGTGLRSTTMTLPSGGDSGKAVVYTDRELSRKLVEHYGDQWDKTNARFDLGATDSATVVGVGTILHSTSQATTPKWRITGVPTTVAAIDGDTTDEDTTRDDLPADAGDAIPKDFYTAYLHGKQGSFVCIATGGASCQVEATPDYDADGLSNGRFPLTSVTVAAATGTSGETLYFKPSGSPSLQLYAGGPISVDTEYMVFGYWREDPTSAAAEYKVGVFAQAFNDGTATDLPSGPITATYDGTAVGMYVEQDPTNPVDTHRQGEFTADVDLTLSGAPATTTSPTLTGTIDDFVTTPTGGSAAPRTADRWIVKLLGTADSDNNGATARIDNLTGVKSGSWEHTFVQAHQYAANDVPPAVTGTFNTRILDFVHILGAFGAEKR